MADLITIPAEQGSAPAWYAAPAAPATAGVILFQDVFGLRPSLGAMADHIAAMGLHVLVPDLYYRSGPFAPLPAHEASALPERMAMLRAMRDAAPPEATLRDLPHFVEALTKRGATGRLGAIGYCMGGARALLAANALPDRIVAAASLHGGNLASDGALSPHRNLSAMTARVYVGCAGEDHSFPPEQSALLAEALRRAGVDHIIENYVGSGHGWTVPDNKSFHAPGAARYQRRMQTFLTETLLA